MGSHEAPPKGPRNTFTEPLKPRAPVEDQALNPHSKTWSATGPQGSGRPQDLLRSPTYHGSLKRSGRESAAGEVAEREGDEMPGTPAARRAGRMTKPSFPTSTWTLWLAENLSNLLLDR